MFQGHSKEFFHGGRGIPFFFPGGRKNCLETIYFTFKWRGRAPCVRLWFIFIFLAFSKPNFTLEVGSGGEWIFKNGEGWALNSPNRKQKLSSTWVKDKNGWSVRKDVSEPPEIQPEKSLDTDKTESCDATEKSGKRNIESNRTKTEQHKRLKKDSEAPSCITVGKFTLYTQNMNYVLVRLTNHPPNVDYVWVKYTNSLVTKLSQYDVSRISQKCRVLHVDDVAFIYLNIQLKGLEKYSPLILNQNFNVGNYTVLNEQITVSPVNIIMDFCVDYSIGEILLGKQSTKSFNSNGRWFFLSNRRWVFQFLWKMVL